MDVGAMIKRLRGKAYSVTRVSADGSFSTVDGSFVPGATSTISVVGLVQPMSGDELISIPEGDRTRERKFFYSASSLKLLDNAKLRKGDRVDVDGVLFEVEGLDEWPTYSRAQIVRVNTNAN